MSSTELSFSQNLLIDKEHPSLPGHFPDHPVVPGVVILDQVLRLWQKHSNRRVVKVNNAKFVHLLNPGSQCRIAYHEKKNQTIEFLITDETQTIIAKGLFTYER